MVTAAGAVGFFILLCVAAIAVAVTAVVWVLGMEEIGAVRRRRRQRADMDRHVEAILNG